MSTPGEGQREPLEALRLEVATLVNEAINNFAAMPVPIATADYQIANDIIAKVRAALSVSTSEGVTTFTVHLTPDGWLDHTGARWDLVHDGAEFVSPSAPKEMSEPDAGYPRFRRSATPEPAEPREEGR